jgi:NAD(P)-dependent dehydrogenase (short-subunit alcohol dehydrogenase family)
MISMTNSLRVELACQGTQVLGVQLGLTDTDLVRQLPGPKNRPAGVAADIVTALAKGETELLADDYSRHFKSALSGPVEGLIAATLGTHEPLRGQLRIALNSGVTKEEIVELFVHLAATRAPPAHSTATRWPGRCSPNPANARRNQMKADLPES